MEKAPGIYGGFPRERILAGGDDGPAIAGLPARYHVFYFTVSQLHMFDLWTDGRVLVVGKLQQSRGQFQSLNPEDAPLTMCSEDVYQVLQP